MGRHSDYTEELAARICERIALGETTRRICEDEDMPDRRTILRWLDNPDFVAKCARARELQADHLDEEIQMVADAAAPEDVQVAKLKIDTMKWRAARMSPKKYGDRIEQVHSGTILQLTDEQIAAKLAALTGGKIS